MIQRLTLLIMGFIFISAAPVQAKILAAVSIAPEAYFLKQIAGDRAEVVVMVPPGADAHTYEPKPRQLADLSKAAVYFAVGMDFEDAWLPRFAAANPKMAIVKTDAGIDKIPMVAHHDDDDDHDKGKKGHGHDKAEKGHEHHDGEPDPHVWLSPSLAKVIGASMRDALVKADPEGAADYAAGYERLAAQCDALDAGIKKVFADVPAGQRKFMVFHPSWGYFARDYGLTQIPIEQLGREPGPKALAGLIKEAKADGVKVIFVQPQLSAAQAETIAKGIGGATAAIDPLAEDWPAGLRGAAEALRRGLAGKTETK
ncbi:MAG: ABC-type metal ion transport system, periplasmic component/surface adhesin [Solidesulfovibrio magneticus str. Maddingley MBC34]|uniref:ABC-type metal ion transport system, periplasmic component/surface adhesin n=1 Tax=Solidesulfovibrio magneticus str. Maddingley MBC34 TaxID=1206767 RepID=K6GNW5_9BACT|nr:MAG: ABC-type metal ion transport system, periplasmic component/surface adhesin [Solidesulfovibrio magneticus str. Maddingley MBC34]